MVMSRMTLICIGEHVLGAGKQTGLPFGSKWSQVVGLKRAQVNILGTHQIDQQNNEQAMI